MTRVPMAHTARAALLVTVILALRAPGTARAQDTDLRQIDETRQVAGDVEVSVEALIREVRVAGWDRDEVQVQGAVHPDREEFVFEGDRQSVEIRIERTGGWHGFDGDDGPDVGPLTVRVPRGASVEVDVVNGALTVRDVDGSVGLESVNGDVRYSGQAESVDAEAVNGTVEVEAPRARRTRASSVNGDVALRVSGGFAEVEAVSGNVDIRAEGRMETVSAETVSGSVEFRGRPTGDASLSFETHSGDVTVWLPGDLAGRLEASSFSGRIRSAFGGETEETSRWTSESSYRHSVGSGKVRVSATSFSGDVRFRTLDG